MAAHFRNTAFVRSGIMALVALALARAGFAAEPALKPLMLVPEQVVYQGDNHGLAIIGLEGGVVEIDHVTLWSVKAGTQPTWPETVAKLPAPELKTIRNKTPGQLAAEKSKAAAK